MAKLYETKETAARRVSIMYCNKQDGRTVKTGYVIGQHWLTRYAPVEERA